MSNFPIGLLCKYDCVFKIDSSFPVILYQISGKEWDGWMPFGLCVFFLVFVTLQVSFSIFKPGACPAIGTSLPISY